MAVTLTTFNEADVADWFATRDINKAKPYVDLVRDLEINGNQLSASVPGSGTWLGGSPMTAAIADPPTTNNAQATSSLFIMFSFQIGPDTRPRRTRLGASCKDRAMPSFVRGGAVCRACGPAARSVKL